jgi:hypothetical protein
MILSAGIAGADTFNIDGDALATGAQNQAVAVSLVAGASTTRTVGAYIVDSSNRNDTPVSFPVAVTISIENDADGILSDLSATSGQIGGYGLGAELTATVKVTAPSTGLTCGEDNAFSGKVRFVSSAANLNPNQVSATINLTVPGPACSTQQPTDAAPTVSAGPDYGPVAEGTAVSLDGTVTDADSDETTAWTYTAGTGVDSGAVCAFGDAAVVDTTVTCTDDGTYTLMLTADDGVNAPVSDTATLTVGNAAPVITSVTATPTSACAVSLAVPFTDAGANDTHTRSVDWGDGTSNSDTSHTFTSAGTKTITATVTDDDAGSDSEATTYTTKNTTSGILAPINTASATPRSVFKLGSSIPVKITVTDCSNAVVSNLIPIVQLHKVDNVVDGVVNEELVAVAATNGKAMRWDLTQYIYNLSTKRSQFCVTPAITGCTGPDLTAGTYRLQVTDSSFFAPATATLDLK